eukprot:520584-Pyramimonas_sp.AAC.2
MSFAIGNEWSSLLGEDRVEKTEGRKCYDCYGTSSSKATCRRRENPKRSSKDLVVGSDLTHSSPVCRAGVRGHPRVLPLEHARHPSKLPCCAEWAHPVDSTAPSTGEGVAQASRSCLTPVGHLPLIQRLQYGALVTSG